MGDKKSSLQNKKDEGYWKENLTPEEYAVLRNKGTENPFTGELLENKEEGVYACKGCGANLFSSDAKFKSGSGWPSFYDVLEKGNVDLVEDSSHGMARTEAVCSECKGHLGHVFNDGPVDKTGMRYCINSVCLNFKKKEKSESSND